jgi:putative membrane protein
VLFCAALLALCLTASAREDKAKAAESDQDFVTKATQSDLAEINVSRIAVKNASDEGVKKFAQQMLDDHGKTSKELLEIVNKKKFTAPDRMDAEHDKMAKKLASLSGSELDKAYAEGQVKDHEAAVALFERQAKDGKDEDLKSWAKKTLPHLKQHLKMARELHKKVGGDKRKDK